MKYEKICKNTNHNVRQRCKKAKAKAFRQESKKILQFLKKGEEEKSLGFNKNPMRGWAD